MTEVNDFGIVIVAEIQRREEENMTSLRGHQYIQENQLRPFWERDRSLVVMETKKSPCLLYIYQGFESIDPFIKFYSIAEKFAYYGIVEIGVHGGITLFVYEHKIPKILQEMKNAEIDPNKFIECFCLSKPQARRIREFGICANNDEQIVTTEENEADLELDRKLHPELYP